MTREYTCGFEVYGTTVAISNVLAQYQLERYWGGTTTRYDRYTPARTGNASMEPYFLGYWGEVEPSILRTSKTFAADEYYIRFGFIWHANTVIPFTSPPDNAYMRMFVIFRGTTPVFRIRPPYATGEYRIEYWNSAAWVDLGHFDITMGTWYCVEVHYNYHASGNIGVLVDGVEIVDHDCDTKTGITSDAVTLWWGGEVWNSYNRLHRYAVDDIGVNNVSGSRNNSWIGTGGIYLVKSTGDGDAEQLTRVGLTHNWEVVSETPPDDATYVKNVNDGEYDLYTVNEITGFAASKVAVAVCRQRARAEVGTQQIRSVVKSGMNAVILDTGVVDTTITNLLLIMETNPVTGEEWTLDDLAAMQIGPQIG